MSLSERPIRRRQLLATTALSAGAVALADGLTPGWAAAAVPAQITLPERGIYDTAAATAWTDGFLTGNGEYGAVLHGTPTLEKVIFNHHRFVLPNGSRGVLPPVNSGQLSRARDKAHVPETTAGRRPPSSTAGRCGGRRPTTPATSCRSARRR